MSVSKQACRELNDRDIIRLSLERTDYFGCLFERYEIRLLRYIARISAASPEESEDILQEAFIKIWRHLHEIDRDLPVTSWIYRIVHNETVSFCRKKRSYGKDRQVSLERSNLDFTRMESEEEPDPEAGFLMAHQVLDKLPVKYREVLVLKFLEKMTYEEISDVLRIPEGTVAVRINRAKKAFKKIASKEHIDFSRTHDHERF